MSDEPVPMLAQYAIRLVEAQRQRDEAIRLLRELMAEHHKRNHKGSGYYTCRAVVCAEIRTFLDSLEGDSK